jgi:hypothetical protein
MAVTDDSILTAAFYAPPQALAYSGSVETAAGENERDLAGEAEAWQRLHAVLLRLTPDLADKPGYFREGWTAKDAVAHIGTWMAEGAQQLRQIAAGTYREGELDVDAANARFLAAMRDVSLETVHLQASAARSQLVSAWHELRDVTPEARFWVRKAGPDHVQEHLPRLEEWVDQLSGQM